MVVNDDGRRKTNVTDASSSVSRPHRSLSQGRDDVAQRRQGLVDVLGLIQDGSCRSSFADLVETREC